MSSIVPEINALGLIAGSGGLPLLLAREARREGVQRLVAVGFQGETEPKLAEIVDEVVWLKVGQLVKMIDAFRSRGVGHCVMAGQIAPRNLFDVRPDWRAMKLLFRLKEKNAHTIFGAIAEELQRDGVQLIEATPWLRPAMPRVGWAVGPGLTVEQREDLAFGLRMAREVSRLEIGQTVVVKEGTVLAVEGFEGTDACLRRGGELAGREGGAVAVKVAKENHDFRFDIPCIGLKTLESCGTAGVAVLGIESGRTIVLDQEKFAAEARRAKTAVVAVE